jgi:hypothetical protein
VTIGTGANFGVDRDVAWRCSLWILIEYESDLRSRPLQNECSLCLSESERIHFKCIKISSSRYDMNSVRGARIKATGNKHFLLVRRNVNLEPGRETICHVFSIWTSWLVIWNKYFVAGTR